MRTHRSNAVAIVAGGLLVAAAPSLAQDRSPEDPLDFTMDVPLVRVPTRIIEERGDDQADPDAASSAVT